MDEMLILIAGNWVSGWWENRSDSLGQRFMKAIDDQNRLYYSDLRGNGCVFRRSSDGKIETLISGRPFVGGIALNEGGDLFFGSIGGCCHTVGSGHAVGGSFAPRWVISRRSASVLNSYVLGFLGYSPFGLGAE